MELTFTEEWCDVKGFSIFAFLEVKSISVAAEIELKSNILFRFAFANFWGIFCFCLWLDNHWSLFVSLLNFKGFFWDWGVIVDTLTWGLLFSCIIFFFKGSFLTSPIIIILLYNFKSDSSEDNCLLFPTPGLDASFFTLFFLLFDKCLVTHSFFEALFGVIFKTIFDELFGSVFRPIFDALPGKVLDSLLCTLSDPLFFSFFATKSSMKTWTFFLNNNFSSFDSFLFFSFSRRRRKSTIISQIISRNQFYYSICKDIFSVLKILSS